MVDINSEEIRRQNNNLAKEYCGLAEEYGDVRVLHSQIRIREIDIFISVRRTFIMSITHIYR